MSSNGDDIPSRHYHRRKTDAPPAEGEDEERNNSQQDDGQEHSGAKKDDKENKEKSDQNNDGKDGEGKDKDGKDSKKPMSRRKKRRLIILAIIVGLILILCGVLYWLHARHFETTDDAFIDGHVSQVAPRVAGEIQSLLIVDNQHVEAGELIAEIDPRDYEVRLAQAEAQRAQAVAQVALQHASIGQAKANVDVADAAVFQADRDLKRFESVDPKAITKQQLDTAIANARSAHAKLESARQAVDAAIAQEGAAQASALQADVEIRNAKLQLSYTKIIAPIAGHIARRTVEAGNVVSPGVPLLAVVSDDLWVTANYKETQLAYMRIGQPVRIEVDSFPGQIFSGHVDSFQKGTGSEFSTLPAENATGNYVKVVQRIPVKIVFDNLDERDKFPMAPGMSVDPRVTVR